MYLEKCQGANSSLIHTYWFGPSFEKFWTDVFQTLSQTLNCVTELNPVAALLGVADEDAHLNTTKRNVCILPLFKLDEQYCSDLRKLPHPRSGLRTMCLVGSLRNFATLYVDLLRKFTRFGAPMWHEHVVFCPWSITHLYKTPKYFIHLLFIFFLILFIVIAIFALVFTVITFSFIQLVTLCKDSAGVEVHAWFLIYLKEHDWPLWEHLQCTMLLDWKSIKK